MNRLMFVVVLLLTLALVVGSTGRHAWSQEGPLEHVQLFGTETLLARSASGIEVWKFDGSDWRQLPNGPAWSDAGGWNAPEYYGTIQTGDVDGDGGAELLARSASGIHVWEYEEGGWQQLPDGPALSDAGGWNAPEYYSTIQTGDVDGDGRAELLARSASGIEAWKFDGSGWQQLPTGPSWSDAGGWNAPEYYSTIQTSDIDADGRDELLARNASYIEAWKFDGTDWQQLIHGPSWSDAAGWNAPEYYSTIQVGAIDPIDLDNLLARGKNGIEAWWYASINWQPRIGPAWSDAAGWNAPEYYSTIQTADIDDTYWDELLARNAGNIEVWSFFPSTDWEQLPNGPSWSDAAGWNAPEYYSTIQTGDIDGDGRAELLARSASSIEVWEFDGDDWQQLPYGPPWSDAAGWNAPEYYSTIQTADIEGLPTTYLPTIQKP